MTYLREFTLSTRRVPVKEFNAKEAAQPLSALVPVSARVEVKGLG